MSEKSQCALILEALQRGEKLTGMDILNRFQCMNYKGRIHDLRRHGHDITTTMIKVNSGKEVAQYSLVMGQQTLF